MFLFLAWIPITQVSSAGEQSLGFVFEVQHILIYVRHIDDIYTHMHISICKSLISIRYIK